MEETRQRSECWERDVKRIYGQPDGTVGGRENEMFVEKTEGVLGG